MNNFTVISYYTKDTPYEQEAKTLINSLQKFDIKYDIVRVVNKGSWVKNCAYKAEFCLSMLSKHKSPIVWIDCDAVILRYPTLFNELSDYDVAVHYRNRITRPKELLSGTVYFNYTFESLKVIAYWVVECLTDENLWDQKALSRAINKIDNLKLYTLPASYVKIFDAVDMICENNEPVIIHNQASRKWKRSV